MVQTASLVGQPPGRKQWKQAKACNTTKNSNNNININININNISAASGERGAVAGAATNNATNRFPLGRWRLAVIFSSLCLSLLVVVDAKVPEMDLPSVSFRDLQTRPGGKSSFGLEVARHSLAELGALEITDFPGYGEIRRKALLNGARCLYAADALERRMPDGSVRRSLAAQTSSSGFLGALDEEHRGRGVPECSRDWEADTNHLRMLVRSAALQVVSAVAGDSLQNASEAIPLVSLEHMHLYLPSRERILEGNHSELANTLHNEAVQEKEKDFATIPLHIDAGYLIAATMGMVLEPPFDKAPQEYSEAGPLILKRADGELVRPRLRPDAILIMAGHRFQEHFPSSVRALPHALDLAGSSGSRAWFGSMLLPQELVAEGTSEEDVHNVQSLACRGLEANPIDLSDDCGEGSTWCWMRCMPIPDSCTDEPKEELRCTNVETGFLWPGGNVMCPTCTVTCPAEEEQANAGRFCLSPAVDMYMNGFRFAGDPDDNCLLFLHESLVLDSEPKFWATVFGTFLFALIGPEMLRFALARANKVAAGKGQTMRLWMVNSALNLLCVLQAYLIMLISMTFSIELFCAIVTGLAIGRSQPFFDHAGQETKTETLCCQVNDAVAANTAATPQNGSPAGVQKPPERQSAPGKARGKLRLSLGGMSCTSCSGAIEKALNDLDGIEAAEVLLLQELALVKFDPDTLTADDIVDTIESIGFEASVMQQTIQEPGEQKNDDDAPPPSGLLHLVGSATEEQVKKAGGIGFIDVHETVATATVGSFLRVVYEPEEVGARKLLKRLQDAGCDVKMPSKPPPPQFLADGGRSEQHEEQISGAFWSAVPPAIVAVMVLLIVMSPADMGLEVTNGAAARWFGTGMLVIIALVASWASFFSRAGHFFLSSASRALQHDAFTMDVLVATSTSVTSVYGLGLTILCFVDKNGPVLTELRGSAAHFLGMAPILLLAVLAGKVLEMRARKRTAAALKDLMAAQPTTALVKTTENGGYQEMPLELLQLGDLCRVTVGNRFPAEGFVVEGSGAADESLVTGESAPVAKVAGAQSGSTAAMCLAGSTLASGDLVVKVTAVGPATTLGRLTDLVARAQGSKPSIQRFADKLASKFVPCILVLSLVVVLVWLVLLLSGRIHDAPKALALKICLALQFGLAVMMLACPCAMGLATPTAISVAVGVASSKHHCLVRDASVMEMGAKKGEKVAIVLDKTGTVTEGKPRVVAAGLWVDSSRQWGAAQRLSAASAAPPTGAIVEWLSTQDREKAIALWSALGAAERAAPVHPIAVAVDKFCELQTKHANIRSEVKTGQLESLSGKGIQGRVQVGDGEVTLMAGGPSMLNELKEAHSQVDWKALTDWASTQAGKSIVYCVAADGAAAAVLALMDPVKPEVKGATRALIKAFGGPKLCEIWLCTGDNETAAKAAAQTLELPLERVRGGQLPVDKKSLVESLQKGGSQVIMVGDGLNDAPALAQADIGVAIGAGAQLACDAADVVLCRSSLVDLLAFRELCLATRVTIFRNFGWAFVFNLVGLPLAAGCGYPWGISISPMLAGGAMACSSLMVVSSSLLLQRFRPSVKGGENEDKAKEKSASGLQEPLLAGGQEEP